MTFRSPVSALSALVMSAGFVLASGTASADITKGQCVKANADAQNLRRDGKLNEARAQLQMCLDPACPRLVRDDCTTRLDELESAQPTIIFDAKDGAGHDLSAVTVTLDGRPLVSKLDGSAVRVEPGEHELVFTLEGQPPFTEKLVIKESEKARHEKVVLGPSSPVAAAAPAVEPAPSNGGLGAQKLAGIGVGGAGVVAVVVGSVFGILTAGAISDQKSDCASATSCPRPSQAATDHSHESTDSAVSTAAFIAGGALIAGGAVLFFTAGHGSSETPTAAPAAARLRLLPSVGPGGGALFLRGEF